MNTHTGTTESALTATDELLRLIEKARSIASQAAVSSDDEEVADLTNDLLETNSRIISLPIATLDDVRAKAEHLLWALEKGGDPLDDGCLEALLRSLAWRTAA